MRKTAVLFGLALSGLALPGAARSETPAELATRPVRETLTSTRSARDFATCLAEQIRGETILRGEGSHYWVVRTDFLGGPFTRWDFRDDPLGGSVAELRSKFRAGTNRDEARRCSQAPGA